MVHARSSRPWTADAVRASSGSPRIVVIDDEEVVTETLQMYLESAGFIVEKAGDGRKGLELASADGVALVILDLMLPGLSGQELCRRLRTQSSVPILMLTARTSENDHISGLEMGADDYVAKPFSPREVVARVRALLRRAETPVSPTGTGSSFIGALEIDRWSRQVRVGSHPIPLTPTEFRILDTLARYPGRLFTRGELLAQVFGPDYEGVDRTIDTHVTNLRRKLAQCSDERYVLTVHGLGYRFATQDDLQEN